VRGFFYRGERYRFAVSDGNGRFVAHFQTERDAENFGRAYSTKWETQVFVLDASTRRFEVFAPVE